MTECFYEKKPNNYHIPKRWNKFEQRIMKIVYVDMDNVLVNFQSGIDALTEEERTAFKDDLDDVLNYLIPNEQQ